MRNTVVRLLLGLVAVALGCGGGTPPLARPAPELVSVSERPRNVLKYIKTFLTNRSRRVEFPRTAVPATMRYQDPPCLAPHRGRIRYPRLLLAGPYAVRPIFAREPNGGQWRQPAPITRGRARRGRITPRRKPGSARPGPFGKAAVNLDPYPDLFDVGAKGLALERDPLCLDDDGGFAVVNPLYGVELVFPFFEIRRPFPLVLLIYIPDHVLMCQIAPPGNLGKRSALGRCLGDRKRACEKSRGEGREAPYGRQ